MAMEPKAGAFRLAQVIDGRATKAQGDLVKLPRCSVRGEKRAEGAADKAVDEAAADEDFGKKDSQGKRKRGRPRAASRSGSSEPLIALKKEAAPPAARALKTSCASSSSEEDARVGPFMRARRHAQRRQGAPEHSRQKEAPPSRRFQVKEEEEDEDAIVVKMDDKAMTTQATRLVESAIEMYRASRKGSAEVSRLQAMLSEEMQKAAGLQVRFNEAAHDLAIAKDKLEAEARKTIELQKVLDMRRVLDLAGKLCDVPSQEHALVAARSALASCVNDAKLVADELNS